MLHVGDRAPEFSAATDAGTTVSLSDFLGKKVVLYFYPKDDTSGCTREASSFRDHHQVFLDQGAVVLGVSTDGVESHANFKQKYQLPFPLISDESRAVVEAYGVWQEKHQYGRTYMGTVRTTFVIDERGVITHIFPKVTVDGHVEEVLAALTGQPLPLRLSSEPRPAPEPVAPAPPPAPPVAISMEPAVAPMAMPAERSAPSVTPAPTPPAPAVTATGRKRSAPKRPAPKPGAKRGGKAPRVKPRAGKPKTAGAKAQRAKRKPRALVRAVPKIVRRTTRTPARKASGGRGQKRGRRR